MSGAAFLDGGGTRYAQIAKRPVRWHMGQVLGVAAGLAVAGVLVSLGLPWYFRSHRGLPEAEVQTLLFLKLLVAGHMIIYVTRSTGWFWQRPWPSLPLILTLEGTQVLGTLFAAFGWLVHPVAWADIGLVGAVAAVGIFLMDAIKRVCLALVGFRPEERMAATSGSTSS